MGRDRCDRASPLAACRRERCGLLALLAFRTGILGVACSSSRKKRPFVVVVLEHGTPPSTTWFFKETTIIRVSLPGIEPGLRASRARVLAPAHSKDMLFLSTSPGSRTPSCGSEDRRAVRHTRKAFCRVARPGVEPGPTASEADMLSGTPTGQIVQYPGLDSNQDQDLRRVLCCPLHHRDPRADDWTCTSMIPLTRRMPFSVEPRRLQGVSERS